MPETPRLTGDDRRITGQARELEAALGTIAGLRDRYGEKDPAALLVFLSGEARYLLAEQSAIIDRLSAAVTALEAREDSAGD